MQTKKTSPVKAACWIVGGLMLVGWLFGDKDPKPALSAPSESSWCQTHSTAPYRGTVDNDDVLRYIDECR